MLDPSEQFNPLFRARKVSAALGVPASTLASWARKGVMAVLDLDGEETVQGSPRLFNLADCLKLAVLLELNRLGINLDQAALFARLAVETVDADPENRRHLLFGCYAGYATLEFAKTVPVGINGHIDIKIDLHALFKRTVIGLRAAEKSHAGFQES
jgi:DNA-binding transcriptional MerR regulator